MDQLQLLQREERQERTHILGVLDQQRRFKLV
jgi:hypothetical protein